MADGLAGVDLISFAVAELFDSSEISVVPGAVLLGFGKFLMVVAHLLLAGVGLFLLLLSMLAFALGSTGSNSIVCFLSLAS